MTCAVVLGLLLMSLADGSPLNFVRPERVVDLGAGAQPNHQGDGIGLTPESLTRRAANAATETPPSSAAPATTPTTAMLVAELVSLQTPNAPTTPPTTAAPAVDPRNGSGQSDREPTGVRAAHRAHVPHTPQLDVHVKHVAHVAHVKHVAHAPHRMHPTDVTSPTHYPRPGRRSSTSSCS